MVKCDLCNSEFEDFLITDFLSGNGSIVIVSHICYKCVKDHTKLAKLLARNESLLTDIDKGLEVDLSNVEWLVMP